MTQQESGNDYPLSEVPMHARKGLASTAMVLLERALFPEFVLLERAAQREPNVELSHGGETKP